MAFAIAPLAHNLHVSSHHLRGVTPVRGQVVANPRTVRELLLDVPAVDVDVTALIAHSFVFLFAVEKVFDPFGNVAAALVIGIRKRWKRSSDASPFLRTPAQNLRGIPPFCDDHHRSYYSFV